MFLKNLIFPFWQAGKQLEEKWWHRVAKFIGFVVFLFCLLISLILHPCVFENIDKVLAQDHSFQAPIRKPLDISVPTRPLSPSPTEMIWNGATNPEVDTGPSLKINGSHRDVESLQKKEAQTKSSSPCSNGDSRVEAISTFLFWTLICAFLIQFFYYKIILYLVYGHSRHFAPTGWTQMGLSMNHGKNNQSQILAGEIDDTKGTISSVVKREGKGGYMVGLLVLYPTISTLINAGSSHFEPIIVFLPIAFLAFFAYYWLRKKMTRIQNENLRTLVTVLICWFVFQSLAGLLYGFALALIGTAR